MRHIFLLSLLPTAALAQNLIPNGDFESGNTGFTSEYTYSPIVNTTEGQYTVRNNPAGWNGAFVNINDHTTNSPAGQMLVVNGATSGNPYLWQVTVPVEPDRDYHFLAHVATAVAGGPANLQLQINGVDAGPSFTAPADPGAWSEMSRDWHSGTATSADLRLVNTNLSRFPNDFYLDDLALLPIVVDYFCDTNGDGAIDLADLNNVLNNFGDTDPGNPGDTNGDHVVDLVDLNCVLNHFGATSPSATSAFSPIPEPSTLAAAICGAPLPLVMRRRRR